ncbi:GntR family transcriptional regulator [Photobacterium sp. DNB23_23_1]
MEKQELNVKIYNQILELILTGQLDPKDRLNERSLASDMSVSRTPVREALKRLEHQGMVERRYANILTIKEFSLEEYLEILDMRSLIEGEAAYLATQYVDDRLLENLLSSLKNTNEENDLRRHHQIYDDKVHSLISNSCRNRYIAEAIQQLRLKTKIFYIDEIPERTVPGINEHITILESMRQKNANEARYAMINHIQNVKGSIMNYVTKKLTRIKHPQD